MDLVAETLLIYQFGLTIWRAGGTVKPLKNAVLVR